MQTRSELVLKIIAGIIGIGLALLLLWHSDSAGAATFRSSVVISKSCRLFGQDHAAKQGVRAG
jgi:hypothetical protein